MKHDILPVESIADIMFQICLGIEYTHNKGMIHKEIYPSNILFHADGTLKICDFGLSAFANTSFMISDKVKEP